MSQKRHKLSGILQHFVFQAGHPSGKRNRAAPKQKPLSKEMGCPEEQLPVYPWCLQAGIYIGLFPSQLPWAAKQSYTQSLTTLSPGFGLCCATTSSQSIPKRGQRAPVAVFICLPLSLGRKQYLTIALLAPARFPAPSCQVYPAFSSSPPPAPRLSGHVCISVSCRLSSPCPCLPRARSRSILPERLRPEPKLARVR